MFVDTSVLIELLVSEPTSDRCSRNDVDRMAIMHDLDEIVDVLLLDRELVLEASTIKHERRAASISKFDLVDGIVLASARKRGEPLLTIDTDLRDLDDAIVLQR